MKLASAAFNLPFVSIQSNSWTDERLIISESYFKPKLILRGSKPLANHGKYNIHALASELTAETTKAPTVMKSGRGTGVQSGKAKSEILNGSAPSKTKQFSANLIETKWLNYIGTDSTQEEYVSRVSEATSGTLSYQEAIAIWDHIKGIGLSSCKEDTFLALMRVCKEDRQFSKALEIFQEMKQAGVQPGLSEYNLVLSCCQRLKDAFSIKDEMDEKKVGCDLVTYNTLIELVAKYLPYRGRISFAERLQKAMALYEEMLKHSVEPDISTYNALMLGAAKENSSNKPLEIYEMIKTANVSPNKMTFDILIRYLGRSGRLKAAQKIFTELKASGINSDASIYNHLIEACSYAPQPSAKQAWALYDEMKRNPLVHPDAQTFKSLIAVSCKVGDFQEGVKAYQLLKDAGHSKLMTPFTYNELIHAAGNAHNMEDAFKMFEEMKAAGHKPDVATYSSLVSACILNKDIARAQATKQQLEDMGIKANQVVFHSLISAYGHIGMWEEAVSTFRQMQKQDPPTLFSYSLIFKACLGKGGLDIVLGKPIDKLEITAGIRTAIKLYEEGMSGGLFKDFVSEDLSKFDIRKLTKSGIVIAMLAWLQEVQKTPPATDLVIVSSTLKKEEATSQLSKDLSKDQLPAKGVIAQRVLERLGLSSEPINEPSTVRGLRVRHDDLQQWLTSLPLK